MRAATLVLVAGSADACALWEECYGPSSNDWPSEAPQNELTKCCTHLSSTEDLNSTDSCSLTLFSKGHHWYGRCCSDWGICAVPAPAPPEPPSFGTCGFVCDTDADCKDCGGGNGGRCSIPYGDNNALLKALTATCVETSLTEPPTDPEPDYRIGVQPLQHYGDLRLVEYESFVDEVKFGVGNIYYDGTANRLRHDWSEYLGQGKQTQVYMGDAKYYIVLKNGICIDFVMREALVPGGRRVGVPTPNWLNGCATSSGNLVYVGRELVNGEWTDHFACYTVVSHDGRNTTIAFQNWHSLGLGATKLGQPLRVAGSNSKPRKMPPSARLTTMFYSNVSDGPGSIPATAFDLPPGCLRVGAEQGYALAAEQADLAPAASADLRRARQRVPRSSLRGSSLGVAMIKLNKQLLVEEALLTRQCASHSLKELHDVQRLLFAARHRDLLSAYSEDDRRSLPYDSADSLLAAQSQQLVEAEARPDLIHIIRDGLCHETVMMYAHHLSQTMRSELKALQLVLPLLPEHELHPAPEVGDELANSTYGGYFDKAGCLVCHVDPRENSVTV